MFADITLVLASGSPRRKQLLEQAEVPFVVRKTDVNESFPKSLSPAEVPVFLAARKADAARKQGTRKELILAADTVVILEGKILGKPGDRDEAVKMLTGLSGRSHAVVTGICLQWGTAQRKFSVCTKVHFKKLSDQQINHYVDHYKPMDKAGGYAIQEWIGLTGIASIEGDYFNVVGLPVSKVLDEIQDLIQV